MITYDSYPYVITNHKIFYFILIVNLYAFTPLKPCSVDFASYIFIVLKFYANIYQFMNVYNLIIKKLLAPQ